MRTVYEIQEEGTPDVTRVLTSPEYPGGIRLEFQKEIETLDLTRTEAAEFRDLLTRMLDAGDEQKPEQPLKVGDLVMVTETSFLGTLKQGELRTVEEVSPFGVRVSGNVGTWPSSMFSNPAADYSI